MGLFDRFRDGLGVQRPAGPEEASVDDQAIARYRYMLRTAPPETIEQAHAEAFAQLTPEQRRRILDELTRAAPAPERDAVLRAGDSPGQLARVATRAEIREPGIIERTLGGFGSPRAGAGPGMGSLFAGSFLSSMAGTVLGSMIAQHFFANHPEAAQHFADLGGDPSGLAGSVDHAADFGHEDAGGDVDTGFDDSNTFDV